MDIFYAVCISFAVTALLAWLLCRNELKHMMRKSELAQEEAVKGLKEREGISELVLSTIDIGVIFYDPKDQLKVANAAARDMLEHIPSDYLEFLDHYGEVNGLRSQLVLGKEVADAIIREKERMFYLKVRVARYNGETAHIAFIRDVTQQFRDEQQRKEYVSNVSHELRTPLTTIKSYSESLIDWGIAERPASQIKKDVLKIYEDSLRMEKLIDDLYLLSSVDESSIYRYMHVEAIDFAWLIKNLTDRMQAQADERSIKMTCTVVAQVPPVYADRNQVERIVSNLISNAIKYGHERGTVQVYIGYIRDDVYVKVKDDGVGIDEANQAHVFERFYRVDDSRSRHLGGRGLGLAIVKELVELHQGSISLVSSLGRGSEFTVLLPGVAKVMRQALYELTHEGVCASRITEAAARDLEQLAESMNIVAQWKSLSHNDYQALLNRIDKQSPAAQGRQGGKSS